MLLFTGATRHAAASEALTLERLVSRAMSEGAIANTSEFHAPVGVPGGSLARMLSYYVPQTLDGRARSCYVVVDRAEPDKPVALLWDRYEEKNGASDSYVLKLGFDGTLAAVHRARGAADGSVREEELSPASAEALALFKVEKAFWLKGDLRKPEPGRKRLEKAGRAVGLRFERSSVFGLVYYDARGGAEVIVPDGYRLEPPAKAAPFRSDFRLKNEKAAYEVHVRFDRAVAPDAKSDATAKAVRRELAADAGEGRLTWFPDAAVKKEFGGDWGLTSDVFALAGRGALPVGQFSQVHKGGTGTYTLIHAADALDTHADLNLGAFHVVRFADAPSQ